MNQNIAVFTSQTKKIVINQANTRLIFLVFDLQAHQRKFYINNLSGEYKKCQKKTARELI